MWLVRIFLWLDNWHPLGPLYSRFGDKVVFSMGRSLGAKVESLIRNNSWCWPRRRNAVTKEIIEHTPSSLVPNSTQEDSVVWTLNSQGFSVKSAFEAARNIHPAVGWWQVVWFKFHVPRWAIIQWLAIKGQLSTKDRPLSVCFVGLLQSIMLTSSFYAVSPPLF